MEWFVVLLLLVCEIGFPRRALSSCIAAEELSLTAFRLLIGLSSGVTMFISGKLK